MNKIVYTLAALAGLQGQIGFATETWHNTSLMFLQEKSSAKFDGKKLDDQPAATKVKFEHVGGNEYGTNYFLASIGAVGTDRTNVYMEWGPFFSFASLFGMDFKEGLLSNFGYTPEFEVFIGGGAAKIRPWQGLGVQLRIPGLNFFQLKVGGHDSSIDGNSFGVGLLLAGSIAADVSFSLFAEYRTQEGDKDKVGENTHVIVSPAIWYTKFQMLNIGLTYDHFQAGLFQSGTPAVALKHNF